MQEIARHHHNDFTHTLHTLAIVQSRRSGRGPTFHHAQKQNACVYKQGVVGRNGMTCKLYSTTWPLGATLACVQVPTTVTQFTARENSLFCICVNQAIWTSNPHAASMHAPQVHTHVLYSTMCTLQEHTHTSPGVRFKHVS